LTSSEEHDPSLRFLEDWRVRTREELEFVWQLQAEDTRRQLAKVWEERIEEAVSAMEDRLGALIAAEGATAARQAIESFHEQSRRLLQCESRAEWQRVLVEIAAEPSNVTALFEPAGDRLRFVAGKQIPSELEIVLDGAPAFREAIESCEPIVATHSESELSAAVAAMAPVPPDGKAVLLPVVSQGETVAVLYTHGAEEPVNVHRLELLTMVAAGALDRTSAGEAPPVKTAWSELSRIEQEQHVRAQRAARVRIAEIRLYQSREVEAGREQRNLYGVLREQIDAGREMFRKEHMEGCPSMVDYFHLEILQTLANDDDALLGPEYPGPLR